MRFQRGVVRLRRPAKTRSLRDHAHIVFVAHHPTSINQALLPYAISLLLRDVIAETGLVAARLDCVGHRASLRLLFGILEWHKIPRVGRIPRMRMQEVMYKGVNSSGHIASFLSIARIMVSRLIGEAATTS